MPTRSTRPKNAWLSQLNPGQPSRPRTLKRRRYDAMGKKRKLQLAQPSAFGNDMGILERFAGHPGCGGLSIRAMDTASAILAAEVFQDMVLDPIGDQDEPVPDRDSPRHKKKQECQ